MQPCDGAGIHAYREHLRENVTGYRVSDIDKLLLVLAHSAEGDGDMSGKQMPP
jgi:hypothetical protein